jgi:ribosomal-protein-alanine N-acetyltransferase
MSIPILTTDRLELRPFSEDDIDRVTELLQAPEIAATTLNIGHPYSREYAAGWISSYPEAAKAGTDLTWAVWLQDDDLLIGAIGIHIDIRNRRGALGYWLGVPYWSCGYMSKAARAVVEYGFSQLDLSHRGDQDAGEYRLRPRHGEGRPEL